jgi:hypothetical protein
MVSVFLSWTSVLGAGTSTAVSSPENSQYANPPITAAAARQEISTDIFGIELLSWHRIIAPSDPRQSD